MRGCCRLGELAGIYGDEGLPGLLRSRCLTAGSWSRFDALETLLPRRSSSVSRLLKPR